MEHRLQINRILLVLLVTVCATQASIEHSKYKKLEPGQNITGTIVAELKTRSKLECSTREVVVKFIRILSSLSYIF